MTCNSPYNHWNKFVFFMWCCCFFSSPELSAQTKITDDLNITINYHNGFILPEYSNLGYLVHKKVQSASLNISKITTGKNDWEQVYNYPEYGFSLFYTTLGNDNVNGREIALFPYFHLNFISRKRFSLYNQTGLGIGYVSRKFDLQSNYLNVAVGSHLNFHFNFKIGASYQVLKKVRLQSGISFDHLSNGNLSNPNLGLNFVTLYSGVSYMVGSSSEKKKGNPSPHQSDHHFEFIYSPGMKHPRSLDPKFYFTSSLTFEYKWEPLRTIHFGLGADLFYDASTKVEMLAANSTRFSKSDYYRSGIHLSQEFVYNRLSLILQEGVYLLLTDQVGHHTMYNRGIVRYKATDHFFFQFSMKSHLNILDYPEFGLGVRW